MSDEIDNPNKHLDPNPMGAIEPEHRASAQPVPAVTAAPKERPPPSFVDKFEVMQLVPGRRTSALELPNGVVLMVEGEGMVFVPGVHVERNKSFVRIDAGARKT